MEDTFSKACSDLSDDDDDSEDGSVKDVASKSIKLEESSEESESEDTSDSEDDQLAEDAKPKLNKLEESSEESDIEDDEDVSRPPKVQRFVSRSQRQNPISVHIREIATKIPYPLWGKVECTQCGRMIKFYSDVFKTINLSVLRNHASYHLKKPIYECQFCHRAMTRSSLKAHMQTQHEAEFRKLVPRESIVYKMIDEMEDEVKAMLTKCFDKTQQDGVDVAECEDKAIYQIETHAQRLSKCDASVQWLRCNQCSHRIALIPLGAELIQHHASMHLGRRLFKCNPCGATKPTKRGMKRHLHTVHALSGCRKNYVDSRAVSKEAIIDAMNRCFAPLGDPALEVEAMEEGEEHGKKTAHDTTKLLKALFQHDKLELKRRLHCTDMIKEYSVSGVIKCRVCEHQIGVLQPGKGMSNQKPLLHSYTHLKDGIHLFKCKRCEQPIKDMFSVYRHMKSKHQIVNGIKKEMDDFTNDHHREIMENLTKCYDWS